MFIRRVLVDPICHLFRIPTYSKLEKKIQYHQTELQQIEQQQRAVYRVISKVRASLDLDVIFRTTTKETCKLLHIDRVAVYKFDSNWGGTFVNNFEFAESGWDDLGQWEQRPVWDDTYLQEHQGGRYRHNETLVASDIYDAGLSQCHIDILEQFSICAYATAPIFVGKELWGILAAYQHSGPHHWTEQEVRFLAQVADQLGVAVKQSKLLADAQRQMLELQQLNHQQDILFHLVTEIRESLDLDVLFSITTKEVRKALSADRVGIFRFEAGTNYHYGEFVAENVLPEYDSAMAIRVKDKCFGDRYASDYAKGRAQILNNVEQANLSDCHLTILERFQIKAQIAMPLIKNDVLWGLLCIHQCRGERTWKSSEIEFVRRLASQFSVALEHAELLVQLKEQTIVLRENMAILKGTNTQLKQLSRTDSLTQIANRGWFDTVLAQEWKRQQRSQQPIALLLFDIDYFKIFNDQFGHLEGDKCLYQIAQAIQKVIQRPGDLLARYGGEEFAVVLPQTGKKGAIAVAENILKTVSGLAIASPSIKQMPEPIVTVSVGAVSQIPTLEQSAQILIEKADKALYQAKMQGRNRWVFYD